MRAIATRVMTFMTLLLAAIFAASTTAAQAPLVFPSAMGEVRIFPLGHASLRLEVGDLIVHVDPWSNVTDYASQPDAGLVLVTHEHQDHLDPAALEQVVGEGTLVVMDAFSAGRYAGEATVLANNESLEFEGMRVTAVPAYNLVQVRDDGTPYHPEGNYNGYLIDVADVRVHIGGDTECVPEFDDLGELGEGGGVDVSFLPINLPFTMPPEDAAECFRRISATVAVPYHQGEADPQVVADLLADSGIDVRVLALP